MSFGNKLNQVLANSLKYSSEDLGTAIDPSQMSEGQLEAVEKKKEREDEVLEQQAALDGITQELAERDDGDGSIGEIRDAIQEINEQQEEVKDIRKQLEVAESIPKDTTATDEGDVELDDFEDEELADLEAVANESLHYRINRLTRKQLGDRNYSLEALSPFQSGKMQRMVLRDHLASLEHVEALRPSLEWINMNSIRTTITSVFSVKKAMDFNRKRIAKLSDDYEAFNVGDWGIELITKQDAPIQNLATATKDFCGLLEDLFTGPVVTLNAESLAILGNIDTDVTVEELQSIQKQIDKLVKGDYLGKFVGKGIYTLDGGHLSLYQDPRSKFTSIHAQRDRDPQWAKRGGHKTLSVSPNDLTDTGYSFVMTRGDLLSTMDDLDKVAGVVQTVHDTIQQMENEVSGKISELRKLKRDLPEATKVLDQLETICLGLFTTVDSVMMLYKNLVYRVTALSGNVK